MQTITITWVGEPKTIKTKYGEKIKYSVRAKEHGEKFIDVWAKSANEMWKVGSTQTIDGVTEGEYNGKKQYTAILPKVAKNAVNQDLMNLVSQVLTRQGKIELLLRQILDNQPKLTSAGTKIPDFSEVDEAKSLDELAEQEFNRM